jgi:Flp pilus assembly protein TadG
MKRSMFFAKLNDQKGTVVVVVALVLLLLVGFAALALDVGYMMVKKNELQNIADSASLAATGKLGSIYTTLDYSAQQAYVASPADIVPVATALGNSMSNPIRDSDVIIGHWQFSTNTFTPGLTKPNAVRVFTHRDSVANGPVQTLLAQVVGINSIPVSAGATASLSGLYKAPEGGLPIPVGISKAWFTHDYCNQPIRLYPTNDPAGCAGWNVYTESPASSNELRTVIAGLTNGTYQSPETISGETGFNFTGGTLGNQAFTAFQNLFNTMKVKNDGVLDKDTDPNTWTTSVPVYDWPDCSNPNPRDGAITIVGFATITITNVSTPPTMTIDAKVICDLITTGPGGGSDYGTIGSIPNLVQ